jgi:hypothetical protein
VRMITPATMVMMGSILPPWIASLLDSFAFG